MGKRELDKARRQLRTGTMKVAESAIVSLEADLHWTPEQFSDFERGLMISAVDFLKTLRLELRK